MRSRLKLPLEGRPETDCGCWAEQIISLEIVEVREKERENVELLKILKGGQQKML